MSAGKQMGRPRQNPWARERSRRVRALRGRRIHVANSLLWFIWASGAFVVVTPRYFQSSLKDVYQPQLARSGEYASPGSGLSAIISDVQ